MLYKNGRRGEMKSGRELFKGFLNNEPLSRPVFIPFIGDLLSRIEDESMQNLTSDPALWANSLVKAIRLFGFDGIVTGFDSNLGARACGCEVSWENDTPVLLPLERDVNEEPQKSPSMELALDVSKRSFSVCRRDLSCMAALTGPYSLSEQLFGSENANSQLNKIKPLMVQMTKAFCETKPDALVFMEGACLSSALIETSHRRIFNTLKNIASYYNIPTGLYIEDYQPDNVSGLAKLNMDMVILGPSVNNDLPLSSEFWHLGDGSKGLGLGLPLNDIEKSMKLITLGLELYHENPGHGLFFTSSGAAGRDIDLDGLHALVSKISNLNL